MIVMKFGGTSVADSEAIARTISIIGGRLDRKPIVVVSALSKVTDLLATGRPLMDTSGHCSHGISPLRMNFLTEAPCWKKPGRKWRTSVPGLRIS